MKVMRGTVFMLGLCLFHFSFSQNSRSFSGRIIDEQSGDFVPFVMLRVEGTTIGTVADEDGSFRLKVFPAYADRMLLVTCLGYKPQKLPLSTLRVGVDNVLKLTQQARDLGEVTVSRNKRASALKVLKAAIAKISTNYPKHDFTFDAYYRERVTENGVHMKFADAAVTIQQGGYSGMAGKSKARFRFLEPLGSNEKGIFSGKLDDYWNTVFPDYRFHDHFSHPLDASDRVKIHHSRRSINHTQTGMYAEIEMGPLGTLGKDLVRYRDLFLLKFRQYEYTLFEEPLPDGSWDYLVKFKPVKPAGTLASKREQQRERKNFTRQDILSGSIRIDQKTLAIKSIGYKVTHDFRKLICSFESQALRHYGYEVKIDYQQNSEHWQLGHILRKDEFIYHDTTQNLTSSYATITELRTVNTKSDIERIEVRESFVGVWCNSLYEYEQAYDSEFWKQYESDVNFARIDATIRGEMESTHRLEEQFGMKEQRTREMNLKKAWSNRFHH